VNGVELERLRQLQVIGAFDAGWARLLNRQAGPEGAPGDLPVAAALLTALRRRGHTCLDLRRTAAEVLCEEFGIAPREAADFSKDWTIPERWLPILGRPGEVAPLIRDGPRLFLQRLWAAQEEVALALLSRAAIPPRNLTPEWARAIHAGWAKPEEEQQRSAAISAATCGLTIVTGGPGTGKTSCVVRALAVGMAYEAMRVAAAAPTGKAVARLKDAWRRAGGPDDGRMVAATLHRLLGLPRMGRERWREPLLPWDVVVVDEMSMVDLELMAELTRRLEPSTRLVLVGDPDQLASVEPGGIFREICDGFGGGEKSPRIQLTHAFRFAGGGGIGRLAAAIREGDVTAVLEVLEEGGGGAIVWRRLPPKNELGSRLRARVRSAWSGVWSAETAETALAELQRFRVLTPHRIGPWGVDRMTEDLSGLLREGRGVPFIVVENDAARGLYNGDGGVWWRSSEGEVALVETGEGIREVAPACLPAWEPAWALTVHKSQGSEYEEVLLVLPDRDSPILTRELLYTGVTRARRRLEIWAEPDVLAATIRRPTIRAGGLDDRIRSRGPQRAACGSGSGPLSR